MTDYYELLGLKKSDKPSTQQIKRAYRKMAKKYHPDLNPDADQDMFAQISNAYEVLKNDQKRDLYDKYGEEGLKRGGPPGGGFGSMFGDIFGFGGGQQQSGPRKGEAVRRHLEVTLEELYNGAVRKLKVNRSRRCGDCDATGSSDPSKVKTCDRCNGQGIITEYRRMGPGFVTQSRRHCDKCGGQGKTAPPGLVCKTCNGKKVTSEKKLLQIHIEKGMKEGQRIVFEGEGDEHPDIEAGDILFFIKTKPHATFTRKDAHLTMKKKISLSAALTGAEIAIKHLDGRILLAKTTPKEVIKPNMVKQIENEGMPIYKHPFENGNLFIHFEIEFPKEIPAENVQALMSLLPPKEKVKKTDKMEEVSLSEPDYSQKGQRSRNAYDEDDEEMEGQNVQCASS